MPVNFIDIRDQVKKMGQEARQRSAHLEEMHQTASQLLETHAEALIELAQRVDRALAEDEYLRCARPVDEALTFARSAPPMPAGLTWLSADGSQINPDRHDSIEFGVINVGAFRMRPGQSLPPEEITHSTLLFGDALRTASGGPLGEEVVALQRDLSERTLLAKLAAHETGMVVALTDGPLELFREPRNEAEFKKLFDEYLQVLEGLGELGVIVAGYVDKPRADLVVRLLELTTVESGFDRLAKERPLRGVTDADLFLPRLQPGQRSALFAIQSQARENFRGALALHFFYLNVGSPEEPWLARVECPRWVAVDPGLVDVLQAALIAQCRMLGTAPYPYGLHRAHEVALVQHAAKQQLLEMIEIEYRRLGIPFGGKSKKQTNKDLSGPRTRYDR